MQLILPADPPCEFMGFQDEWSCFCKNAPRIGGSSKGLLDDVKIVYEEGGGTPRLVGYRDTVLAQGRDIFTYVKSACFSPLTAKKVINLTV
jgi:hypothetical protein